MANSNRFQFRTAYQRDLVDIFARVSFGASGAPTLQEGKGISSIVRLSAGLYEIRLREGFAGVMMVAASPLMASGSPASPIMVVREISQSNSLTSPRIRIEFQNAAGAATDPASGSLRLIHIITKNTPA